MTRGELRLIFPNIKPNKIAEAIVLIDESRFRIPGEFTAGFSWANRWPAQKMRWIVEAPRPLTERLKRTATGAGVPEPQIQPVDNDRVRLTWQSNRVEALSYEPNRAPTRQVGPTLWLSSLKSWDAFVAKLRAPLVSGKNPHPHAEIDPAD